MVRNRQAVRELTPPSSPEEEERRPLSSFEASPYGGPQYSSFSSLGPPPVTPTLTPQSTPKQKPPKFSLLSGKKSKTKR